LILFFVLGCVVVRGESVSIFRTGQTVSYLEGDDGDLQRGAAFPEPRFIDKEDGTILDLATGLMWVQNPRLVPNNSEGMVWSDAVAFCNELNYAGHSDWVLPSRRELISLLDYGAANLALPDGHPFDGLVAASFYWTGTSYAADSNFAWRVYLNIGSVEFDTKLGRYYVWPVRSWE
jgi:hypothetical protein